MGDGFTAALEYGPSPGSLVLRRARVVAVTSGTVDGWKCDLELLEGPLRGEVVTGLFYREFGRPPETGEVVTANTVGVEMGLGTGGVAPVLPGPPRGAEPDAPENANHFVKLPYTPLQFPAVPPEQATDLVGAPLIVLPLHSQLAPACCAAADLWPDCRVSFVWQEGGALPGTFSDAVRDLKEKRLLGAVVSSGNCFGGDVEAPNIYSGLLAAAAMSDVIFVGIGPGVTGTATPYGHGGMAAATALNAAHALGAEPVLAPRISEADPRPRHRGVSHHTRAVLEMALGGCRVAFPAAYDEVSPEELPPRHSYERVAYGAGGLEDRFGVIFQSMGRSYKEDPFFFETAAAAVMLALGQREAG
ncbi:MAG: DUF3866 family protein [Rubrobacteraceae bacterium]